MILATKAIINSEVEREMTQSEIINVDIIEEIFTKKQSQTLLARILTRKLYIVMQVRKMAKYTEGKGCKP